MTDSATSRSRVGRPWIAAVLTLLLPGSGHLYAGHPARALAFLAGELLVGVACLLVFAKLPVEHWNAATAAAPFIGYRVWAALRSVAAARRGEGARWPRAACGIVVAALFAAHWGWGAREFAGLVRRHLVGIYRVPTGAMASTIVSGDRILADLLLDEASRGDVILFTTSPDGREVNFVKRVVGLPGERLEIPDGAVHIDGRRLDEPYLDPDDPPPDFGPVTVPDRAYFVLGDRRNGSRDSRFEEIGAIPRERIVGRATVVAFSVDPETGELRWDRLGKRIH